MEFQGNFNFSFKIFYYIGKTVADLVYPLGAMRSRARGRGETVVRRVRELPSPADPVLSCICCVTLDKFVIPSKAGFLVCKMAIIIIITMK